jgi:DNA-binding beta-propeller fold protein YncE
MRILRFIVPLLLLMSLAPAGSVTKLRQVGMVDLPGDPGFSQVAVANGQIVITRPVTNTIEIFSPVKRRVIARISQIDNPRGIAVDDAGNRAFVALAGSNRIAVINSQNWQVEKLVHVVHRPERVLWVAETKTLYCLSALDRTISVIDPKGETETAVVELNALPQDLLADPSRHAVLVSLQDSSQVVAIDASQQIARRFQLAASEPTGLALDNAHRRLYVAVRFAVLVLDADSGEELFRIPAPGGTSTLVLDPASKLLYASAGDGSVLTIDLERHVVDHELPTSVRGYGLAFDPVHRMLFLPGGREGRSKMVILTPMTVNEQPRPQTAKNSPAQGQTAKK